MVQRSNISSKDILLFLKSVRSHRGESESSEVAWPMISGTFARRPRSESRVVASPGAEFSPRAREREDGPGGRFFYKEDEGLVDGTKKKKTGFVARPRFARLEQSYLEAT